MTEALEASWRVYPAASMIGGGLLFALFSARRAIARSAGLRDPFRALELMTGFRLCVVGLATAGFGAAWMWSIGWLAGLAAVIAGEELLESSFVIAAVRNGPEAAAER